MKRWAWLCMLCLAFQANAGGRDHAVGTLLKTEGLSADPRAGSQSMATLERGERVEILERQGGWLKVKARQITGWLRYLSVKHGEMSKSGVDAGGILSLAGGRAGTGEVVSVAGIRGIDEEQLKSAQFNEREYAKLEGYGVSREVAQQFARSGGLRARVVEYPTQPVAVSQPQGIPR
ncbi:MAG: SH3 domain-containing protein [Methylophilaceae bacterium]|nr:SH3 domain-containing protein [Methylophilaceae bacterium]